ncbi:MAG: pyridoxal-phosphate dependent enzyme [Gelidibacter sp.]
MTKELLLECHKNILPFIHRTSVLSSHLINGMVNANVLFKCENFQKMGAFKMRGATNAIMQLNELQKAKGVVTHSSGNFAQAISLAAKNLDVKAYIVMPENAPKVKVSAVKGYGGVITQCEPTIEAREKASDKIVQELGASFIHPSNDMNVIIGNATACLELLQDDPDLDYVVTPVGGGGLVAGTALAAHFFGANCKVVGAEPKAADDAFRSLKSGKIETNKTADTIADGLRTHLGDINFPIILKYVDSIITVEEEEIINAMRLIYERLKIVIEPSSAVAFAAILKEKEAFRNKKIGVILSGGNVDLNHLPFGKHS